MAYDLDRLLTSSADIERLCDLVRELVFAVKAARRNRLDVSHLKDNIQGIRHALRLYSSHGGESVEEEIIRPACVGQFKQFTVAGVPAATAWQAAQFSACSLADDWVIFPTTDAMSLSVSATPEPLQLLVDVQRETAAARRWLKDHQPTPHHPRRHVEQRDLRTAEDILRGRSRRSPLRFAMSMGSAHNRPAKMVSLKPPQITIDGVPLALTEEAAEYLNVLEENFGERMSDREVVSRSRLLADGYSDRPRFKRIRDGLPPQVQEWLDCDQGGTKFRRPTT